MTVSSMIFSKEVAKFPAAVLVTCRLTRLGLCPAVEGTFIYDLNVKSKFVKVLLMQIIFSVPNAT